MRKIILTGIGLWSFSFAVLAAQCPAVNNWQLSKDNTSWQLSESAKQAGWQVYPDLNMDPAIKTITSDVLLRINLTPFSAACQYEFDFKNALEAYQLRAPDFSSVHQPPFHSAFAGFICETHAGTPENCQWEWM